MLSQILADLHLNHAWLSGSYVRERLVRQDTDSQVDDINVLIPFEHLNSLKRVLIDKYKAECDVIHYDNKEPCARLVFHVPEGPIEYKIDVFSCEDCSYLSPPPTDVDTLCWTGTEFVTWFIFGAKEERYYGKECKDVKFSMEAIMERCKNKQAIAMTAEWDSKIFGANDLYRDRVVKLADSGWSILNMY